LLVWADTLGAATIVARLEAIGREPDVAARAVTAGPGGASLSSKARFDPPASLRDMARDGRTFHAG
jgi:hypothetical protein